MEQARGHGIGGNLSRVGLLAAVVWAVLLGVIVVRGYVSPNAHNCYHYYVRAGRAWLHGEDMYLQTCDTSRYSPLVNAGFAPLALLPDWLGADVWRLVNAAAFLGGLYWWLRVYTPPPWTATHRALVFLLVIPLALGNINSSQANPLLLGLMLAGTAAAGRERWNWAAVFVAGACLLKVYPLALALLLIALYPRRFTLRVLIALAAGILLPFVLQNPWYVGRQYGNWWTNLCIDDRSQWPLAAGYRDLWLLIRAYNLPVARSRYMALQLLVAGIVGAMCLLSRWRARRPRLEVLNTALGLAVCWMTLCGPATEGATYVLIAPTLVWAVAESWLRLWPVWIRVVLLASAGFFLVAVAAGMSGDAAEFTAWGPHPLGGLLLLLALLAEQGRRLIPPRNMRRDEAVAPVRAA
jgi:hypothetical protein